MGAILSMARHTSGNLESTSGSSPERDQVVSPWRAALEVVQHVGDAGALQDVPAGRREECAVGSEQ